MSEEWRPVAGCEGFYEVNTLGQIRATGKARGVKARVPRKPNVGRNGYQRVVLRGRRLYVHRVVATAFLGEPEPDEQVNHLDGVKTNNRLDNLEWVTRSQNAAHARHVLGRRYGRQVRGEEQGSSVLTEATVKDIRARHSAGEAYRSIAESLGVDRSTVWLADTRRTWRHVL